MLTVISTAQYRKDFKRIIRRGMDTVLLKNVIQQLREQTPLDPKYKDHSLKGEYAGQRECHLQPDWLLIYEIDGDNLILTTSRTGSHADLFGL